MDYQGQNGRQNQADFFTAGAGVDSLAAEQVEQVGQNENNLSSEVAAWTHEPINPSQETVNNQEIQLITSEAPITPIIEIEATFPPTAQTSSEQSEPSTEPPIRILRTQGDHINRGALKVIGGAIERLDQDGNTPVFYDTVRTEMMEDHLKNSFDREIGKAA